MTSDGWNFNLVVRVNDGGYVNDRDYDAAAKCPLLAIVGYSYIEAVTPEARLADFRWVVDHFLEQLPAFRPNG